MEIRRQANTDGEARQLKTPAWKTAEAVVARLLWELLPEGCLVLNDIPFPYGNLDHVVIRPGLQSDEPTAFLVETKSQRGRVSWNGKELLLNGRLFRKNYLSQINRSIRWMRRTAKRLFGVNPWIVAVLVFPNADVEVKRSVKRVNVMAGGALLAFIRSYRRKA